MSYLRLIWVFFRLGIINVLQYRANFLAQMLSTFLGLISALGGLAVVFSYTDNLDGWKPFELVGLVGVYFLVGGLLSLLIRPSMERFMRDVREGTLDFTLMKPEDSQLLVSIKQIEIWKLLDIGLGIVLLIVSLAQLGNAIGLGQVLAFVIALMAGATIVYSFLLMLATCAFWFTRVDNILVIFQSMYEAGRWPVNIYPPWLRSSLTFLVPVAFAITVPAEGLTGRLTWQT